MRGLKPCLGSFFPMRPTTSLAPKKVTSPNHAQRFPISLSVHQRVTQTDPHPLLRMHLWASEFSFSYRSSLPQDLGYAVLSLPVAVSELGAMLHCPRGRSPGRHMSLCGTLPPGVDSHVLWGLSPWWAPHLLVS